MIKKQFRLLIIAIAIIFSLQSAFGMEERDKSDNQESKSSHSKEKKSKAKCKKTRKFKLYDLLVKKIKRKSKAQSLEKNEIQDEDTTLSPFAEMATELQLYILGMGLKLIVCNNSIYTPLEGVKEFLDTLSLVSKKFQAIAKYLGWNYNIDEIGKELNYKQTVKECWKLDIALEDWLSKNGISNEELLNGICLILSDRLPLDAIYHLVKDSMSDNQDPKILKVKTLFEDKSEEELYETCARAIIRADDQKVGLILLLSLPYSDLLIPLLLLKKINILLKFYDDSTVLQRACRCPNALKQILAHNELYGKSDYINLVNKNNSTALDMAWADGCIESVKILLEHGANPDTQFTHEMVLGVLLYRDEIKNLPLSARQLESLEIIHQALREKHSKFKENKEKRKKDNKNNRRNFPGYK